MICMAAQNPKKLLAITSEGCCVLYSQKIEKEKGLQQQLHRKNRENNVYISGDMTYVCRTVVLVAVCNISTEMPLGSWRKRNGVMRQEQGL